MAPKGKPWNQFPRADSFTDQSLQALDWMLVQLNQLTGQGNTPQGSVLGPFGSSIIDPTGGQVITGGQRTGSVTTTISYTSTTTSVTFYWDGTNGSQKLIIARDDGTTTGPLITGSPQTVSGLTANTQYFFYMYWDEVLNQVKFATVAGVAVGSPAYAFTSANTTAAQQQILKNRILLSPNYSIQGITTPSAGTGSGSGGTGGGSGGAQQTLPSSATSLTVVGGGFNKIQAGTTTSTGTGANGASVTFPVAFTTVVAVTLGNYSGSCDIHTGSLTTSGFSIDTSSTGQRIDWIAVGT